MQSLKNLNESLDLILVAAANNVDCVEYDAPLGSIQIAKSSAILWSPIEQGGLGFYEEIYGAQNEKAISEWLKRTVKADASSSMTYMLGVGIAGAISTAAISPTGAIFLGGWALSAGLGSAVGAAGI